MCPSVGCSSSVDIPQVGTVAYFFTIPLPASSHNLIAEDSLSGTPVPFSDPYKPIHALLDFSNLNVLI